jgi:hypothetical protein
MMIFPANGTGTRIGWLAGKTGKIGLLFSPGGERDPYRLPFALDNGRYGAWIKNREWDEAAWRKLLRFADKQKQKPRFVLVPDVVTSRKNTRLEWDRFAPDLIGKYTLAYAAQDGATKEDIPPQADLVFVGGSTNWKWETVGYWASNFPRVHVGRVNQPTRLPELKAMGVESCDGTGWFRGDQKQQAGLERFLLEENQ